MRSGPNVTRNVPPAADASTRRPPAVTCPDHSPTGLPTSTHAGVRGARPPPIAVAARTASLPRARGSTPGEGQ
eukprot:15458233-Alexandrium_andersonii.AAC.1